MREILFRGKRMPDGKWVEGYINHNDTTLLSFIIMPKGIYDDVAMIRTETIGQYTGLKDKNGKRIFEGDILEFRYGSRYPVFWDCDMGAFGSCYYSDFDLLSKYSPKEIEVIGNTHDDPELLEGGKDHA